MEKADKARKVGITTSLLMVLSLIIGAFVASAAAALGGHRRDEV
jgi:branched-subunit amino acid ABC-type transport system permease component